MASVEFVPLGDVKQTIEKVVRKKPSVEELTKVEVPGKPSPADMLEDKPIRTSKKLFSRTKKSDDTEAQTKEIFKREYILIITEKPQAALKIANALGDARKLSDNGVSYYEVERNNHKILVASAVGHLFNLN